MRRPTVEWDPSWDDDWQTEIYEVEGMIEEEQPVNPEQAVEYYRYGYSTARKKPLQEWSDVESDLYQEYMSGTAEQAEEEEELGWESASGWTRRGWEAGQR